MPASEMSHVIPNMEEWDDHLSLDCLYIEAERSLKHEKTHYEGQNQPPWLHHEAFHRDAEKNMQAVIRRCYRAESQSPAPIPPEVMSAAERVHDWYCPEQDSIVFKEGSHPYYKTPKDTAEDADILLLARHILQGAKKP